MIVKLSNPKSEMTEEEARLALLQTELSQLSKPLAPNCS
jgi:hypothetical protein